MYDPEGGGGGGAWSLAAKTGGEGFSPRMGHTATLLGEYIRMHPLSSHIGSYIAHVDAHWVIPD